MNMITTDELNQWSKLRLRENILKVYDFASCFYLNVNEYLMNGYVIWNGYVTEINKNSRHLQLCIENSILYKIIHNIPLFANEV